MYQIKTFVPNLAAEYVSRIEKKALGKLKAEFERKEKWGETVQSATRKSGAGFDFRVAF